MGFHCKRVGFLEYKTPYYALCLSTDDNDSEENPNEKITIEFVPNAKITTLIDEDGILTPKYGYHYAHSGGFVNIDTIAFHIGGPGGLGGGWSYNIKGIRKV